MGDGTDSGTGAGKVKMDRHTAALAVELWSLANAAGPDVDTSRAEALLARMLPKGTTIEQLLVLAGMGVARG